MKVNPHIFRGYDLRGIVGEDLSPELALHLGKAHGSYLSKLGQTKAIVSYDCRQTSPEYAQKIAEGLASTGLNVVNIGRQMVGTFYWAQHHLQIPGGVFVTASHNPPEFNGFKFANDYSETLVSEGMQEIRRLVESEDYIKAAKAGRITHQDVREDYFADLLGRLHVQHKLKVVVDPSNTTAGEVIPELLRRAGCEVVEFNTKVDPNFPLGVADPTEIHIMERLGKEVRESKADLGFTYDADGDRVGICDEKGQPVWNDVLLALFAKDVLTDHPGATIMFNLLCSKVVPETIKQHGGKPFMWRTGHSFLKKKNQEVKAAFIGELSGHFFFSRDFFNHDDGAYSTLRLVQATSRTDKSLSQLITGLPPYKSSPQIHVYCDDNQKTSLVEKLAAKLRRDYPKAEVVDDERAGDGLRLEMPDSMFVVRYSQNGPYIVVKFESQTDEGYEKLRRYILKTLKAQPELDWDPANKINVNIKEL
ncbi:MAG TPA: phosphomannomutase/phosphoglucomutase, partial [Candidatus Saccharimonadales bacterium]|nr:phosphomannomutase/phosphoglucomutase [Candidatus Saccharimonadales bacterium]